MNFIHNKEMVLYHGTENKFNKFDNSYIGSSSGNKGFLGLGFYFTKSYDKAQCYGQVKEVILNLENPFVINGELSQETVDILNRITDGCAFDKGITHQDVYNGLSYAACMDDDIPELISENLISIGYDGIIYGDYDEVVVFYTDNINIIK